MFASDFEKPSDMVLILALTCSEVTLPFSTPDNNLTSSLRPSISKWPDSSKLRALATAWSKKLSELVLMDAVGSAPKPNVVPPFAASI
jgi:hypothetical protein